MRIFEHPNLGGDWRCRICGEATDSPVVLISKDGTEKGNIVEAEQYHVQCLDLSLTTLPDEPESLVIYMKFRSSAPVEKKEVAPEEFEKDEAGITGIPNSW